MSELLEQALHTSYPPVHLAFAIQQHVAPRVIKLQNFIGRPIEVYNSIIAGCLQSVPMTRVYLQKGIEKVVAEDNAVSDINRETANLSKSRECELVEVTSKREMAKTQLYVDDCAQSSRDKCGGIVHNRLGNSFYVFHKMNKKLKLVLSEKGVIVANCHNLALRLQKELLKLHGIKYKIKKSTRDLGISHTAGTCKPNQLLLERLHGKEMRISKIGRISRMHRNGRNLYKGSGFSATTWGHQVCGLSSSDMELVERHAAKSTGIQPAGRCRYTANCLAYGEYGHPKARIIRETFTTFFQLRSEMLVNKQEEDLRIGWQEAATRHSKNGSASIRGPLGVVIDWLK